MAASSKKISRLEKEAILRAKEFEYKRQQSAYLLTNSCQDNEEFENERHRRHSKMRQTRQIQREIDHQVGIIDKLNERRQHELQKRQRPITTTTSSRNYLTSSAATSSLTNRSHRTGEATDKYTSSKPTSTGKLH